MKIKQVEELVGITSKNIRFYESQGLLTPERADNGYREYHQDNIEVLKKIKLFCDGSCNPQEKIGYGAYLLIEDNNFDLIFLKSKIDMKGLNKKQFTFLFITIIFCFLINYYIKYYGFSNIEPGSSIKTILVWGYTHLTNPLDFVRYLVAIFLTFGSFILIYFINFSYKDFIINIKEDSYMYSFSLAFLFFIFAFLAASDMERVLWQAFPFFCIFFLSSMEKLNKFYIAFGFLLSIPIMRLVSLIPEASQALPLILKSDLYMINDKTPGDTVGFYSWLAEWMEIGQVASWGIYMIFIY